jgi:hypothetical protein
MDNKFEIIEIILDFKYREEVPLDTINPETISQKLLQKGTEFICLSGALLEQFDGGIVILMEDSDLTNIFNSYSYLEENLLINSSYQDGEYLHNGKLYFTSQSNEDNVSIEFEYIPNDSSFDIIKVNVSLTINEYLYWWRSMAHGIYNLASSLGLTTNIDP